MKRSLITSPILLLAILGGLGIAGCTHRPPKSSSFSHPGDAVIINFDSSEYPLLADVEPRLRALADEHYPKIRALLWDDPTEAPDRFTVSIKASLADNTFGQVRRNRIELSGAKIAEQTNMLAHVFLHEMAHAAQDRSIWRLLWSRRHRHWGEGLADYAVFKLNVTTGGIAPCCNSEYPNLASGYSCTGAFLLHLDRQYGEAVIKELNRRVCRGGFAEDFFVEKTGKSLADLWREFEQTPAYTPAARELNVIINALNHRSNVNTPKFRQRIFDYIQAQPGGQLTLEARAFLRSTDTKRLNLTQLTGTHGYLTYGVLDGVPPAEYPFSQTFHYSPAQLFPDIYHFTITKPAADKPWLVERVFRTNSDGTVEDLSVGGADGE